MAAELLHTQAGHIWLGSCGTLQLTIITDDVSDEEWEEMLGLARANAFNGTTATLAYQNRGSATAAQRKRAATQTQEAKRKPIAAVALLTNSVMVRGTLTAYSWLVPKTTKYAAFAVDASGEALEWLSQHAQFDRAEATQVFEEMCREAGVTGQAA